MSIVLDRSIYCLTISTWSQLSEAEIAVSNLKKYKLPGSNQIPAELHQAGGETLLSAVHKLISYGIGENCLTNGRSTNSQKG
jgi:hypothetical protein